MPNNFPFQNWYWSDWKASTSMLSPMARCAWFELVGAMWLQDRSASVSGTMPELARVAGMTEAEMSSAIAEIERRHVADIDVSDGVYTVVCRRLKGEMKERDLLKNRVKKHRGKCENVTKCNVLKRSCNADVTNTSNDCNEDACKDNDTACNADVTGHTRAYPLTINHKYPSLNPAPVVAGRDGPREGRGGEGDSKGYPSSAAEVMEAASASGYRLSEGQAAEWLRMKQADGWKDYDGRPIVSWRRLLSSWCQSSGVQTEKAYEEQLEREARRQEAERQRRIAERKAADEAKASIKKLDVSQALALMKL